MTAVIFIAAFALFVCTGAVVDDIIAGIDDARVRRVVSVVSVMLIVYAMIRLVV